jgi:hypothetical protein
MKNGHLVSFRGIAQQHFKTCAWIFGLMMREENNSTSFTIVTVRRMRKTFPLNARQVATEVSSSLRKTATSFTFVTFVAAHNIR